jgi:hypothetical protein
MENNEVSANGDRWIVDYNTGEAFLVTAENVSYLAPLDIKTIVSQETFNQVVKERMYRKRYRLWVSPMLLDMVIERQISIPSLSILCLLGQQIGYNNMVYTSIKKLSEGSGYVRQTVSSAVVELKSHGLLREPENKLEERESRFFLVNPLYFFLGYYPHRDNLIKDWIMG